MKKLIIVYIVLGLSNLFSLSNDRFIENDYQILNNENFYFKPDSVNTNPIIKDEETTIIDHGRIIIKKVSLPITKKFTELTLTISLKSNGDSWDKTGSCFIIPKESVINMINVSQGKNTLPKFPIDTEDFDGIIPAKDYLPPIEIMRFFTPFGVGYFNNYEQVKELKPIYVHSWADSVVWQTDVTDYLPLLEGEFYLGFFVDTWNKGGYLVSADIRVKESQIKGDKKQKLWIYPLLNTVNYHAQNIPDLFARHDIETSVTIPLKVKSLHINYISTGHGGYTTGDEFNTKENLIYLNNQQIFSVSPWKTDCHAYRHFNPTAGVWSDTLTYHGKLINERIASSDYARSGWAPGSDSKPYKIKLNDIYFNKKDPLSVFRFSIPKANPTYKETIDGKEETRFNCWLVSAVLIGEY